MAVSVYNYSSYREFLQDFVAEKQAAKNLSFRYFSQKCGFKRPNYFQSLLSGERKLTMVSAKAVAAGLKLNQLEQVFFETLVQLSETQDPLLSKTLVERLERMKRVGLSTVITGTDTFETYVLPVIWEMFQLTHSSGWTVDRIRSSLSLSRVSTTDIEKSLRKLQSHGLVSEDNGVFVKIKDGSFLGPEEEVTENGMRECHRIALRHAAQSLELDVAIREMQNLVVAVSQNDLPLIKSRIRDFLVSLNHDLTGAKNTDQVVQIHFSVVPLCRRI